MIPSPSQMAALGALGLALVAGGIGFAAAWQWQEANVLKCEMDFSDYIQEQDRILNEHKLEAKTRQQETANDWAKNLEALRAANAGEFAAYKRCVAAGRCGAVVVDRVREQAPVPGGSGGAVPAPGGSDATESNAVLATPGVAADCSETTLQLNALQDDICKQPGLKAKEFCS